MENIYFWSGFGIVAILTTLAGAATGVLFYSIFADCFKLGNKNDVRK